MWRRRGGGGAILTKNLTSRSKDTTPKSCCVEPFTQRDSEEGRGRETSKERDCTINGEREQQEGGGEEEEEEVN
jgi:hypothetical protein